MLPLLLSLLHIFGRAAATSCGQLQVHPNFRLGERATQILSADASDMTQCLELCCHHPHCDAVTLSGVVSGSPSSSCLLASCDAAQGCSRLPVTSNDSVVTVLVLRSPQLSASSTTTTTSRAQSHGWGEGVVTASGAAPVWALALSLLLLVCMFVSAITALAACCWSRRRRRKKQQFAPPAPALHAFNPS